MKTESPEMGLGISLRGARPMVLVGEEKGRNTDPDLQRVKVTIDFDPTSLASAEKEKQCPLVSTQKKAILRILGPTWTKVI